MEHMKNANVNFSRHFLVFSSYTLPNLSILGVPLE